MALSDDVIALVHDLSSAGLAVTLIGAPGTYSKVLRSHSPTRDSTTDTMAGAEEKQHKYSTMSEEVCPTREREVIKKKINKKMDVRYLNEIKSFKEKLKSSYLLSCTQQQCPMIQERLNQHQQDCHSGHYRQTIPTCSAVLRCRDRAINVSPTLSRMRLPKFTLPFSEEGRPVQTELTMKDFNLEQTVAAPKHMNKVPSDILSKAIPLRKSRTREVLPKRNFYKDHLQNEILNWLQGVPMFYTLNFTTKDIKENIVNSLAEKINTLTVEIHDSNYEVKTKIEIENCLSRLPMWLPGTKRDQATFKEGLKEKLWIKIKELNENFLGIKYEKSVGNEKEDNQARQPNVSYEKEITDWSQRLQLLEQNGVTRRQVVDLIMKKLTPLLKIPLHTTSYKLILKGEIIDILDDLPLALTSPRYKTVQLNRFAEELANRLLTIQIKHEANTSKNIGKDATVYHQCTNQVMGIPLPKVRCSFKSLIQGKVTECLDKVQVCHRNDLIEEICLTFIDAKDNLRSGNEQSIKTEIHQYLRDTGKLSEEQSLRVAKMILNHVRDVINNVNNSASTSFDSVIPELSGTISVYMWGLGHATSTPKKATKKDIPKLNAEEQSYIDNVATVIRAWMNTLPKKFDDDKTFKETIINDLAGDIMDELKVGQLAPDSIKDKDKYLNYLMFRWLYRYEVFPNETIRNDAPPYIEDFIKRLKNVQVPNLTASQHGTRQAMEHIKHMEGERGWQEDYLPKGIDVLEDQISVWMNEQPTEIYANKDKGKRDKQIHDLALTLQDRLRNKSPEEEIDRDINKWLGKVVKPKEKEHIGLLTQNLKEKIINTPQDQTLEANFEDRKRYIADRIEAKKLKANPSLQPMEDVSNIGNIEGDPDKTIREFIAKFIEHNYDIDDPMAIGAFSHLLKTELRRLSPPTRKEVYETLDKSTPHEKFNPEKLRFELEYIKAISDWLNNIPIEPSYNTAGNRRRIDFINDLAKNIQEIEEQRLKSPEEMNYNYLIASLILHSMHSYGLPILPEHKNNTPLMVDQLLQKLVTFRSSEPNYTQENQTTANQSTNSDIKDQNLSEFIVDYIRVNGKEIADDETKLEAWTARLLKEVKKIIHDGADPSTLYKAEVYTKFNEVPIPGDESVKRYGLEIAYVKEISDWMKNLPLLLVNNKAKEEQIKMISELAEKMAETEATRSLDPKDDSADKNLEEYITNWISRLPLDPNKDLVVPIVVQQLMNRMKRVTKREQTPQNGAQGNPDTSKNESSDKKSKTSPQKDLGSKWTSKEKGLSKWIRDKVKTNPATTIVEAIEKWSNKLPIKGDDKEEIKSIKEGIARKLYQKVGELNVDPRIFNDDLLYKELLGDEIDTQLENVPQNPELQKNREKLKEGLLNTIIDTKSIIKEKSAGDSYKHKLEATIDVSIPNPVQNIQVFDPGFEIYKNHLASMFILENFDHANDDVKAKYEKRVRDEIDKYFENARNRNALPLTKDQIYNELYSALFKVPMPNETAVIDEVEQIKTRCEIDTWFEDLPLRRPDGVIELLEWDKILSTLAKRIHDIEKHEPKANDKIHKEIIKWLEKLPLLPDSEGVDGHAKRLQNILKSTSEARKYVAKDPNANSKGKKIKEKKTKDNKSKKGSANTSQVAGPSGAGENYISPNVTPKSKSTIAKPCLAATPTINKKSGDFIVEVVEDWCDQLPLMASEETNLAIKDNVSTRIIIQISDLNMDPEIFNNDVVYDELLDEELENVMSNLPVACDFEQSKDARKHQLKEMIKSIKPLIKEERARHEYKEELNNTVASILKPPLDTTAEKIKMFMDLKDDVVENFVQYNYNKNDEEGKQIYKKNLHDAVLKYFMDIKDNITDDQVDPLVRRNQLLSELGKIPIPNEALKEEVEEIKMKGEVEQFFQEQSIPEGDAEKKMKKNLAKKLHNLERSGHDPNVDKKMKHDIMRCLKKLNQDVSPKAVEDFVENLKNNEPDRKSLPITDSEAFGLNETGPYGNSMANGQDPRNFNVGGNATRSYPQQTFGPQTSQQVGVNTQDTSDLGESQWVSLQPASEPPNFDSVFDQTNSGYPPGGQPANSFASNTINQPQGPGNSTLSPRDNAAPVQNLDESVNYNDFAGGPLLNSTMAPKQGVGAQTVNEAPQNPQGTREVSSSPGQNEPIYGQVATRRPVAQGPPGQNAPPENAFQGPMFKYVPTQQPFTVPIIEPGPMPGSHGSMRPQRPIKGPENSLIPKQGLVGPPVPPIGHKGLVPTGNERRSKNYESSDDEEVCKCERGRYRNCRGPPYCMVAMEEFFEDCVGFGPMWCGVPFPECFYY